MTEHRASDQQSRPSVTMYDPARDIYTASDKASTAKHLEERKVSPSPGQEHGLDATGAVGPETDQGTSSGLVGQVSGISSASITTSAPSFEPIPSEPNAGSGATRTINEYSQSSAPNNPKSTSRETVSPSNPTMAPPAPSSSPSLPKDVGPVGSSEVANQPMLSSDVQVNRGTTETEDAHKPNPPGRTITAPHNEDNPIPSKAQNGITELHTAHETDTTTSHKNMKQPEASSHTQNAKPGEELPRVKRRRLEASQQKNKKRAKPTPSAYSRRDTSPSRPQNESRRSSSPRRRSPEDRHRDAIPKRSPPPIPRSPSPDSAAPVRKRKRPGGGARVSSTNVEAFRRRQEERERQQQEEAQKVLYDRGVHDVVRQHYNAVPERGREWRKTDSRIKGLRSFNNWVKSTLIQKFSPDEDFLARTNDNSWANESAPPPEEEQKKLLVVDIGCGKGGDLGKWHQAPQPIDLYVGLDPAEISIDQAQDRYLGMRNGRNRQPRRGANPLFHAEFYPKDCFGEWLGDVPIVQRVGINPNVGPEGNLMSSRWGSGGFDVVVCMFTMHYAFECEEKARQMLRNVAGALKKGGRFLGVGPNSDVITARVAEFHKKKKAQEAAAKEEQGEREDGEVDDIPATPEWGNDIYRVRFPGETPEDGVFRPPFGWKYSYFMEEAVEEIPEYVVPWEAFRALTEDYNLELQYRKPFVDIWREEKDDPILGPLSERMGVRSRTDGSMLVNDEELEAASFYHAFCFYKV